MPRQHQHHRFPVASKALPRNRRLRADPDLLRQIACIRKMADDLAGSASAAPPRKQLFAESDMKAQLEFASRLSGDAQRMVQRHLNRAKTLGPWRDVVRAPYPSCLDELHRSFPHCSEVISLVQGYLALCQRSRDCVLRMPPLLLVGDPGIGKTAFIRQLAQLLGTPIVDVCVAALSAGFSLAGLDSSYDSAKPGQVWYALDTECMSPIVLLDELDKPARDSQSMLGSLYPLLERHTASRFVDQAVPLPINASYVNWFATCNDVTAVEPALRSRFEIASISAPTRAQMPAVLASVHREMRSEYEWMNGFDIELDDNVMALLAEMTPRELKRSLAKAYALAARAGRRRLAVADLVQSFNGFTAKFMGFL